MQDTIQATVNYALSLLGFICTLGIFIGIPMGIFFLVTSGKIKDAKHKSRRVLFGILMIVLPPAVIIFILVAFALLNTILGATAGA